MKLFTQNNHTETLEGGHPHMMHEHRNPIKHIPPHKRKTLMRIEFGDDELRLFNSIYGDEDEAAAAVQVLLEAPPEIQILAIQLINHIKVVA